MGESQCRTKTEPKPEERNPKMLGIRVTELTVWLRSFEIKKCSKVYQLYQFHQNRLTGPYNER